jgi:hypothetical protein
MDEPGQTGRRSENGKADASLAAGASSDLAHSRIRAWRKILALLRAVHPTWRLEHLACLLAAASASRRMREWSMAPIARLKRRLLVVAALTWIVFCAIWLLWPEPIIGPASFHRIQLGMPETEIEAAIGPPSHQDSHLIVLVPVLNRCRAEKGTIQSGTQASSSAEWRGSRYTIVVVFENGRATYCGLFELGTSLRPPSLLHQIRNWLGW